MAEPTLRQLRYFVELSRTMHFGDAAARCGVSQPNLSAQVQQLEKALGTLLVERTSRGPILTPAGKEVCARAERVLAEVDDLLEETTAFDPLRGRLRLGVIPTIAPYVLPRTLPAVRSAFPELELHLAEDFTERLLERLRVGDLDLVMLALPLDGNEFATTPLASEPFVMVMPSSHDLASVDGIKAKDFDPADLLLLQEGHCLRDQALKVCRVDARTRDQTLDGTSLTTLVQMVANGLGITLLPSMAVNVDVPVSDEVVLRRFVSPEPSRTVGLAWRSLPKRDEAFMQLAAVLKPKLDDLISQANRTIDASRAARRRPVSRKARR